MRYAALLLAAGIASQLQAQNPVHAGLFRYPDVSASQIVFSYANDIWVVPKTGGTALKLSSPPGVESFPKFSPDGKEIAFTGNYDGNSDVYLMPVSGGIPERITWHGGSDRVVDWTNDGKSLYFASTRESGKARFNQFYLIPAHGGAPVQMPFAYAEWGSYSPDAKDMALTFRTQAFRNWKRYRGGWNADIYLYHFASNTSENITGDNDAANEFPMWHGDAIYFLSDRGKEKRMNLWRYLLKDKSVEQLTHFTDYDAHFPSMGPDDIVFEAGGELYLFNFNSQKATTVNVNLVTDKIFMKPKMAAVGDLTEHATISPDGSRVILEARGDLFSLPAEKGYVKDLTQSTGVADRYPSWSPDGKQIAWWSDRSGEYELWIMPADKPDEAKKISSYGPGFRYSLYWSPDSKKLAFIDKAARIKIYDISSGLSFDVDQALVYSQGNLENFSCSWSPDSRWLAYDRDLENMHNAIFLYDTQGKQSTQVTSGFYSCSNPVFDPEGKYLFFRTEQAFHPYYSNFDNTFIYANATLLASISLQYSTPSVIAPENDTVSISAADADKKEATGDKKNNTTVGTKNGNNVKSVNIDLDGLQDRMVLLPVKSGNIFQLATTKGKLLFLRAPNTGANDGPASLQYFDLAKKEEKTILANVDNYLMSANREKLLVQQDHNFAVIAPAEGQKWDKKLATGDMQMNIVPEEEWKQIFTDVWRLERDYFYDAEMHGVDWNLMKKRYEKMLEGCTTREEVDFVIGELIGELNASHTYHGGGDMEKSRSGSVGYLGINWQADGDYYKVKRILRGASWDVEARSSLSEPGLGIKEGNYLLAVNGIPIKTNEEPYAAFQGLGNKTVELTYNTVPSFAGAKKAIVKTMSDEYRLRHLAWIENMRKKVEQETNGEVGYVYVPSTGIDGQTELLRQLNAQTDKKALVIDERFNDGGQIPDRFVEMLDRKPLAYFARRDGEPMKWPPFAVFGPKVMLINGWSGSGGDAFPDFFRKRGLGPLIGSRTWGGLIGISGCPSLIDGGSITVPTFRQYNIDGTWFKEGHGVDPDIAVPEDLGAMAKGTDPQLEKAIETIKDLMKTQGYKAPRRPAPENRN